MTRSEVQIPRRPPYKGYFVILTSITDCIFCHFDSSIDASRRIQEYHYWKLVVQQPKKLLETKQSAGLLISKRHFVEFSEATDKEAIELKDIIKDAARRLCVATGTTYVGQETVGFNQGTEAGQTIYHCHVHVLPVAQEDPDEMKVRSGIGGAFEALRRERLGQ